MCESACERSSWRLFWSVRQSEDHFSSSWTAVASECPTVGTLFVLVFPSFNVCTGPGSHCHSQSPLLSLLRSQNRQTDECWYCSLLVFFFRKDGSDWMMIQVSCCWCTFLCIVCLQILIVSLSSLVMLAIRPAISFQYDTHTNFMTKKNGYSLIACFSPVQLLWLSFNWKLSNREKKKKNRKTAQCKQQFSTKLSCISNKWGRMRLRQA